MELHERQFPAIDIHTVTEPVAAEVRPCTRGRFNANAVERGRGKRITDNSSPNDSVALSKPVMSRNLMMALLTMLKIHSCAGVYCKLHAGRHEQSRLNEVLLDNSVGKHHL